MRLSGSTTRVDGPRGRGQRRRDERGAHERPWHDEVPGAARQPEPQHDRAHGVRRGLAEAEERDGGATRGHLAADHHDCDARDRRHEGDDRGDAAVAERVVRPREQEERAVRVEADGERREPCGEQADAVPLRGLTEGGDAHDRHCERDQCGRDRHDEHRHRVERPPQRRVKCAGSWRLTR